MLHSGKEDTDTWQGNNKNDTCEDISRDLDRSNMSKRFPNNLACKDDAEVQRENKRV